jgi:uncharacterized membrane protein YkvA (DUF1232 family)
VRAALIGIAIGVGVWLAVVGLLVAFGRRTAARELASLIPNLLALFRGLLRDPRVPRRTKAWLWVGVAWVVSPIDLIPEFLPIVGPLDDAIVAALVLRHVMKRTDRAVLREHWRGDPATLDRMAGGAARRAS